MPTLYNGTKDIQHNHNCFAYAFDVMDPPTDCTGESCKKPFHQPGYAAGYGKIGDKKYCSELLARLKGDMPWIKITKFITPCKPGYSKIAIVIDPNNDYHFYRQDSNGFWSHKPGGQQVTNLDASNKLIYNPEFCNRDYRTPGSTDPEELNYSIFCSFLEVPRNRPVQAKRGGGFILGGASSMKGGGKYHPSVQPMLNKMNTKKSNARRVQPNGTQPRAHRFTAIHRPRFLGTIGRRGNTHARLTATRRSTRRHTQPDRYSSVRTNTYRRGKSQVRKSNAKTKHVQNANVSLIPRTKLTNEMKVKISTEFPGEGAKKIRAYLYSHPEEIYTYIEKKREKEQADAFVAHINPTSQDQIRENYPGDYNKHIRHALYKKLSGKQESLDDYIEGLEGFAKLTI